jgi:hypothetical protein
MRCDLCDQEFANSEELKRHQERVHPMGDGEGGAADMMERPAADQGMPEAEKVPEPAEHRSK